MALCVVPMMVPMMHRIDHMRPCHCAPTATLIQRALPTEALCGALYRGPAIGGVHVGGVHGGPFSTLPILGT